MRRAIGSSLPDVGKGDFTEGGDTAHLGAADTGVSAVSVRVSLFVVTTAALLFRGWDSLVGLCASNLLLLL